MSENAVEKIVDRLVGSIYDPQSEARRIRENIDVKIEVQRRHVVLALKDRSLFDEVLILIDKHGYAGPKSTVSSVRKLTPDEYSVAFYLNDNRYVTATVGDVYVPILFME